MLPGDSLHSMLDKWGFQVEPGCPCLEHIAEMNRKGKRWCRENISTILGWLETEYKRRNGEFSVFPAGIAKQVVRYAIWKSQDEAQTSVS